jgi:tRNA-2-methylthio-N6-dimethylallyladenosine synthase
MPKYLLETYGCQMNVADSELISGILKSCGWEPAQSAAEADLIIVNTCAVRERAADRVIGHVRSYRQLKRRGAGVRIALVGCLARYGGKKLAAEIPEVDLFLGPDAYRKIPELLAHDWSPQRFEIGLNSDETYEGLDPVRRAGANAWVSVMRGCDRLCAYCMVPFARGRERSLPLQAVLRAVGETVAEGFPSVTLLGQTVTSYRDGEHDFARLLGRVAGVEGLRRLRFLSPHPADFTTRLLATIARQPIICRHLHLPVQSGSNAVLSTMRRGYTREDYLALIREARETIAGLAVTTDIIVGFPGETREQFRETLDLMRAVRFDGAFMFAYSSRPGTRAARFLKDDLPESEKRRRLEEVIALQEEHSRERFGRLVGRTVEVLVEGPARHPAGHFFGKTDDFKNAVFSSRRGSEIDVGRIVLVRVLEATSHTLKGQQMC